MSAATLEAALSARSGEDEEVDKDIISAQEDVFSYFMLAAPIEQMQHKRFTIDACMSYLLVGFALAIQGVLLFCVYDNVISENTDWHDGIVSTSNGVVNTGKDWDLLAPKKAGCNDGSSLCTFENGVYTCAPPSMQLIGRWSELDLDNDGVWSRDEMMKSRQDLKCKYAVDPLEVFEVLLVMLQGRKAHIFLHENIKNGTAIEKMYYTYILGDIAMCSYRNVDMCGNLVKRGVFDAPLKHGHVPRVGSSIRSALDYCHALLKPEGLCERVLPSTYSTWRIESVQECEEPKYQKFVYQEPQGGDIKSLLEVDYKAVKNYGMAKTPIFFAYKTCIVFIWILLILSQLREVIKTWAWVYQQLAEAGHTPGDALRRATDLVSRSRQDVEAPVVGHPKSEPISPRAPNCPVKGMSLGHRIALNIVTATRVGMLCLLMYVGLNFLGRSTDYIGLLLDGVALIFIVEVAKILYERVLRQEVRSSWMESEPIELNKFGFFGGRPDLTDLLWFVVVGVLAVAFLWNYTNKTVVPVYDALQCACLSQGEKCREAATFSYSFWDNYWTKEVPESIQKINALKHVEIKQATVLAQGLNDAAGSLAAHTGNAVRKLVLNSRHHHLGA